MAQMRHSQDREQRGESGAIKSDSLPAAPGATKGALQLRERERAAVRVLLIQLANYCSQLVCRRSSTENFVAALELVRLDSNSISLIDLN